MVHICAHRAHSATLDAEMRHGLVIVTVSLVMREMTFEIAPTLGLPSMMQRALLNARVTGSLAMFNVLIVTFDLCLLVRGDILGGWLR